MLKFVISAREMTEKQKILVCGDVEGKFDALFKRIEAIVKKSGPFDMLLCVGNFFGINNKEFIPYKTGDKKVPVITYILGPNKEDHLREYPSDESEFELCPNVYYLGKRGVYTDSKGLKIAYISGLSGTDSVGPWTYSEKEVSELCDVCIKGNPSFRGVDILLSSQWPSNIIAEDSKEVPLSVKAVSDLPSYLCMKLKPRYIFSGIEGVFYERPPFRCPNLGDHDVTMETVSRFIALARVGNADKRKWIYALSLTPLEKMKLSELLQKTTDETPCPFKFHDLESRIFNCKRKSSGPSQYFYDMNASENTSKSTKKNKKPRIEFDQSKCWFCLASPSVEKHLIISVGASVYLALAKDDISVLRHNNDYLTKTFEKRNVLKVNEWFDVISPSFITSKTAMYAIKEGALVEEHFLICPIEHYQSSIGQPTEVLEEIEKFKDSLRKFYDRNGRTPVFFERNYKTSHMQLQAVPIPKNAMKNLKDIFIDESECQGFRLDILDNHNRLDQVLPPKVPYFTVELSDGTLMYTKIQGSTQFPLNFAREILASGPILNVSNRTEWKECLLEKEEEETLVMRLRTEFEPFDFTL